MKSKFILKITSAAASVLVFSTAFNAIAQTSSGSSSKIISGSSEGKAVSLKELKNFQNRTPKTVETIPAYPPSKIPSKPGGKPPMHLSNPKHKFGRGAGAATAVTFAVSIANIFFEAQEKANMIESELGTVDSLATQESETLVDVIAKTILEARKERKAEAMKAEAAKKAEAARKAKARKQRENLDRGMRDRARDFNERFDRNRDGKVETGTDIPDTIIPGSFRS